MDDAPLVTDGSGFIRIGKLPTDDQLTDLAIDLLSKLPANGDDRYDSSDHSRDVDTVRAAFAKVIALIRSDTHVSLP